MADASVTVWIRIKDQFTKQLNGMNTWLSKIGMNIGTFGGAARSALGVVGSMFSWIGRQMKWVLLGATALGTYMAKNFVRGVIAAGVELESWRMKLGQVLGPQAAAPMLKWLREFDDLLAGGLDEAGQAFIRLKVTGVKNIQQVMLASRDAALTMGTDFGSVVQGFITMIPRTWRMMGVTIDTAGKKAVISMGDIRIETEKTMDAMRAGLLDLLQRKFGGATEKMKNTWKGAMLLLKDAWQDFQTDVAEAGVFEYLKSGMKMVIEWIDKMKASGQLEDWAARVSDSMIRGIRMVIAFGRSAYMTMSWLWEQSVRKTQFMYRWTPVRTQGRKDKHTMLTAEVDAIERQRKVTADNNVELDRMLERWEDIYRSTRAGGSAASGAAAEYRVLGEEAEETAKKFGGLHDAISGQKTSFLGMGEKERMQLQAVYKLMQGMTKEEFLKNTWLQNYVAGNKMLQEMYPDFVKAVEEQELSELGLTEEHQKQLDVMTKMKDKLVSRTEESRKNAENEKAATEAIERQEASRKRLAEAREKERQAREKAERAGKDVEAKLGKIPHIPSASLRQQHPGMKPLGESIEKADAARIAHDAAAIATQAAVIAFRQAQGEAVSIQPTININVAVDEIAEKVGRVLAVTLEQAFAFVQNEAKKQRMKAADSAKATASAALQPELTGGI